MREAVRNKVSCLISWRASVCQLPETCSHLAFKTALRDVLLPYGLMFLFKDNFCRWVHRSWGSPLAHEPLLLPGVRGGPRRAEVHHEGQPPVLLRLLRVPVRRVLWGLRAAHRWACPTRPVCLWLSSLFFLFQLRCDLYTVKCTGLQCFNLMSFDQWIVSSCYLW